MSVFSGSTRSDRNLIQARAFLSRLSILSGSARSPWSLIQAPFLLSRISILSGSTRSGWSLIQALTAGCSSKLVCMILPFTGLWREPRLHESLRRLCRDDGASLPVICAYDLLKCAACLRALGVYPEYSKGRRFRSPTWLRTETLLVGKVPTSLSHASARSSTRPTTF